MKRLAMAMVLGLLTFNIAQAADKPSLLIYISPEKYQHPTLVGIAPLYTHWVEQAAIAEGVASRALAASFANVGVCEAGKHADIIAWVKPRLVYNPVNATYYARLKVQLHLGDGSPLATYKAEGQEYGSLTSIFADQEVGRAFDQAMKQVMTQISSDNTLQSNIQKAIISDFTRSPCGIVAIVGREPNSEFSIFGN